MRTTITAQQNAFFTKHGFIEFEIPHENMFPLIEPGRDSWRKSLPLQHFLTRTLGALALSLTGKPNLRLGCDQFISDENRPKQLAPLKELFSIQGFAIGAILAKDPIIPERKSSLGILPLPTKAGNILFFRTDLILDWPHLSSDIYMVLYALVNAVYIHNPKDPLTHYLKTFGYNFGDQLKNEFHPVIALK